MEIRRGMQEPGGGGRAVFPGAPRLPLRAAGRRRDGSSRAPRLDSRGDGAAGPPGREELDGACRTTIKKGRRGNRRRKNVKTWREDTQLGRKRQRGRDERRRGR